MWNTLRADPVIKLWAAVLAGIVLLYSLPILSDRQVQVFGTFYLDPVLTLVCVFALLHRLRRIEHRPARRFWTLIAVAHGFWFASYALYFPGGGESWTPRMGLAASLLVLAYYAAVFLAITMRPHLKAGSARDTVSRPIEFTANMIFAFGLLAYLVLIPAALVEVPVGSDVPVMLLYVVLDGFLLVSFLHLRRTCGTAHWGLLYGVLAIAAGTWAVLDLLLTLTFLEILPAFVSGGTALDLLWCLPYSSVVLAARLREYHTRSSGPYGTEPKSLQSSRRPRYGMPVVVQAMAIPVFHLSLYWAGALDVAARPARDAWALFLFVILAGLAVVQHWHQEAQRVALASQAETRAHLQAAVAEIGRCALAETETAAAMDEPMVIVARTLGVEYSKVLELLEDGSGFLLRAGVGWEKGLVSRAIVPTGTNSQAGYALLSKDPVIVLDLRTETRFRGSRLLRDHGVVSGMSVIIRGPEGPYGVLGAHTTRRREFTEDDVSALQSFANILGIAIERIQAEKALRESREQLLQLQKVVSVGQLVETVTHDFGNLITTIMISVDNVLHRLDRDHPLRPQLKVIKSVGKRAAVLTERLLAFSYRQELELQALDLNAVVENMDKMLRDLIGENVDLVTALEPALGAVRADAGQLELVIMNLILNARDAMPDGGKLTIETADIGPDRETVLAHPEGKSGPCVMLSVSDTGCGIDEATQLRIFEPFFTTKEMGKGTGLGLATARSIVEQHDGTITVESEPGTGTTFKIFLPSVQAPAQDRAREDRQRALPLGSETILVVEDDHKVRTAVASSLEDLGYRVLSAGQPEEAVEKFAQHAEEISLLLTDVVMPGSHGPTLYDRLQRKHPSLKLKVLFMSGYALRTIVRLGVQGPFLRKPFTPEALAWKVREALDN